MVEKACLFVLLAVVGVRPLIAETYDSAGLSMTTALEGMEDPSPARTLIIDVIIMLAAVGWLVGRARRNDRSYRWCGMEWGAGVVAAAAGVSCVFAGNRRLAINGAVDWLSCVLLCILLVQLLRDRWRVRLALCVILASAAAQAVECFHQVYWVFDETQAMYAEQREAFWSRQGVALDSEQVELFEARMGAREASGYLSHANVTGAYLVMCGLAALAVGASCWGGGRNRTSWLAMAAAVGAGALMLFGLP